MDLALQHKRQSDFLAHRDPAFASIDANHAWESASQNRRDLQALFANVFSAKKRSVVQTTVLRGNLAEVLVSRHGSIVF